MHAAKHSLADTFASPGLVSLSARRNGRGPEGPEARVKRGRGDLRPWRMGQDRLGVHRCAVRRCVEMSGVSCIVWSCSVPPGSLLARLWETPQGQEIHPAAILGAFASSSPLTHPPPGILHRPSIQNYLRSHSSPAFPLLSLHHLSLYQSRNLTQRNNPSPHQPHPSPVAHRPLSRDPLQLIEATATRYLPISNPPISFATRDGQTPEPPPPHPLIR